MSERASLPAGTSVALRERFGRLSADDQSRVLARLNERRQARLRPFKLTWIGGASPGQNCNRPPVVVMPSLFGGVSEWLDFFRVGFEWPVYGLELTGAGPYWKPEPTLHEIGAASVEVLLRDLPAERVHLVGHSFGGRLAYEVGQQLDSASRPPISVVLLDARAGPMPRHLGWRDLRSIVVNMPAWLINELSFYGVKQLGQRIGLRRRFRLRGYDNPVNRLFDLSRLPEDLRRRLEDSHRAFKSYQPRPTQNRVSCLRSRIRSLVHVDWPDSGWSDLVPASLLTVVTIPGDHGSVLHPRWTQQVRSAMEGVLDRAERESG